MVAGIDVTKWQIATWLRVLFGMHLIYSGAAYVLFGYLPPVFQQPETMVGRFHMSLDELGLYSVVKYVEFFLGLLVLSNRFVPVAAVMELPITVIISYINIFVMGPIEHRHWFTGVQELFLNVSVLVAYGAYYRTMLYPKTRPQWLWNELDPAPLPSDQPARRPAQMGTLNTWLFFIIFMVLVMNASWFLGTATRRLPPRDWAPPIAAFVWMLAAYRLTRDTPVAGRQD